MTDKKDCMTMEQAEQKMECLREVFSIVRLVDGEMLEKRAEHSPDADAMEMCQCYSFWNKAKPCENCISMKSLREKKQAAKLEFLDSDIFQVFSRYVEIDGKPYVMEMLKKLDEDTLIDAVGYGKMVQKLSVYNDKLYRDALTGAYNRRYYEDEIKHVKGKAGVAILDVDDFKLYNTIYGYAFGDKMLQSIAKGLQLFINHNGICARSNSDCFYALVSYHDGIAEDLRDYLKVVMKEDLELDIIDDLTMSFGMYMVTQNEVAQDILDYALLAHKNAKAIGKNCMIWYDQNLLDRLNQDNLILKQMHRALAQHQFQMYLQPQFEVSTLKIIGAEALVRWKMDNGTFLYPDDFISLFEKDGYIYELDFEILEQACRFIKTYNVASDFSISVNFSRVTIHHKQFYQRLHDVLEKYKTPIGNIEIEITESAFHDLSNGSRAILLKLREEGFTIAMDDFGSGYSSLNLLDSISVDVLKIDKFFLVERSQKREMIIGLIVDIAKTLDMKVICEGVETEDDIDLLRKLNCPLGQGYYISKPILAQQFAEQFLNHEREIHG